MKKLLTFFILLILISCTWQNVFTPLKRIENPPDKFWEVLKVSGLTRTIHGYYSRENFDSSSKIVSLDFFKKYDDYCLYIYSLKDNDKLYFSSKVGYFGYSETFGINFDYTTVYKLNNDLEGKQIDEYLRLKENDSLWTIISDTPFWETREGFINIYNNPYVDEPRKKRNEGDVIIAHVSLRKKRAFPMRIGLHNDQNSRNGWSDCKNISKYLAVTEKNFSYWDSYLSDLSVIIPKLLTYENQHFLTMMYLYDENIRQHMPIIAFNKGNNLVYLRLEEMMKNSDQSDIEKHMRFQDYQTTISMIKDYYKLSDSTTLPRLYYLLKNDFNIPEDTMLYSDWVYTQ